MWGMGIETVMVGGMETVMVGGMGMETRLKVGERGLEMVHVEGRRMRIVKVLVKVGIPNVELSLGG